MSEVASKSGILGQLRQEILSLQGFRNASCDQPLNIGLGAIEAAFPNGIFPTGAVHEFISHQPEQAAATNGFMSALAGQFLKRKGTCLWISNRRRLFPPALKGFDIDPAQIVFVDVSREKEVLWTIEQALKCEALSAVVGELKELNFTESQRLQLAVEESRVTGFIHRYNPKTENTVACVSRWKIAPLASKPEEGMPGLGFPRWDVHLEKVRNGRPGRWQIEWGEDGFQHIKEQYALRIAAMRKTG